MSRKEAEDMKVFSSVVVEGENEVTSGLHFTYVYTNAEFIESAKAENAEVKVLKNNREGNLVNISAEKTSSKLEGNEFSITSGDEDAVFYTAFVMLPYNKEAAAEEPVEEAPAEGREDAEEEASVPEEDETEAPEGNAAMEAAEVATAETEIKDAKPEIQAPAEGTEPEILAEETEAEAAMTEAEAPETETERSSYKVILPEVEGVSYEIEGGEEHEPGDKVTVKVIADDQYMIQDVSVEIPKIEDVAFEGDDILMAAAEANESKLSPEEVADLINLDIEDTEVTEEEPAVTEDGVTVYQSTDGEIVREKELTFAMPQMDLVILTAAVKTKIEGKPTFSHPDSNIYAPKSKYNEDNDHRPHTTDHEVTITYDDESSETRRAYCIDPAVPGNTTGNEKYCPDLPLDRRYLIVEITEQDMATMTGTA